MKRSSGVLMHVSSLPGEYSIGSFGKEAKQFVDFLSDCGFSMWQVLPFCLPDEYNSPYKSYSAFSGNPYFIDLDVLVKKGLITADEAITAKQKSPYLCEFTRLNKERIDLLKKASSRFTDTEKMDKFFSEFPHTESFRKRQGTGINGSVVVNGSHGSHLRRYFLYCNGESFRVQAKSPCIARTFLLFILPGTFRKCLLFWLLFVLSAGKITVCYRT